MRERRMTRLRWLLPVLLTSCVPHTAETTPGDPARPAGAKFPNPTMSDPFNGLPAVSTSGKSVALPTFTTGEQGQGRSITFMTVGDWFSELANWVFLSRQ